MTKTIALLGATGSIGRQTLEAARELGLTVAALTAHTNIDLLERQARQFRPRLAAVYDAAAAAVRGTQQHQIVIGVCSLFEVLTFFYTAKVCLERGFGQKDRR